MSAIRRKHNLSAVLKREIKRYYTSFITYVYYALYFLTSGITLSVYCLSNYNTQYGYYVLAKAFYVSVVMIPLFTMQMFAGERRSKTDQLLFTSPVSCYSIVLSKYISAVFVLILPIIVSIVFPVIISGHGEVNLDFLVCSYIAVCLGVLFLTAIGMFISTMTSNPILAAVFVYVFYALLFLMRIAEALSGQGNLYKFIHNISFYNIYYDMVSGIVRTGNIVFVIVVSILLINLSWMRLIFNRVYTAKKVMGIVCMLLCSIIISIVFAANSVTYDFTPEKILTLSDETIEVLNSVDKETTLYYIGKISNANATYQEFLSLYEK